MLIYCVRGYRRPGSPVDVDLATDVDPADAPDLAARFRREGYAAAFVVVKTSATWPCAESGPTGREFPTGRRRRRMAAGSGPDLVDLAP